MLTSPPFPHNGSKAARTLPPPTCSPTKEKNNSPYNKLALIASPPPITQPPWHRRYRSLAQHPLRYCLSPSAILVGDSIAIIAAAVTALQRSLTSARISEIRARGLPHSISSVISLTKELTS